MCNFPILIFSFLHCGMISSELINIQLNYYPLSNGVFWDNFSLNNPTYTP